MKNVRAWWTLVTKVLSFFLLHLLLIFVSWNIYYISGIDKVKQLDERCVHWTFLITIEIPFTEWKFAKEMLVLLFQGVKLETGRYSFPSWLKIKYGTKKLYLHHENWHDLIPLFTWSCRKWSILAPSWKHEIFVKFPISKIEFYTLVWIIFCYNETFTAEKSTQRSKRQCIQMYSCLNSDLAPTWS